MNSIALSSLSTHGRGIPVAPYQGVQAAGDLEGHEIRLHDAWSKNSERFVIFFV